MIRRSVVTLLSCTAFFFGLCILDIEAGEVGAGPQQSELGQRSWAGEQFVRPKEPALESLVLGADMSRADLQAYCDRLSEGMKVGRPFSELQQTVGVMRSRLVGLACCEERLARTYRSYMSGKAHPDLTNPSTRSTYLSQTNAVAKTYAALLARITQADVTRERQQFIRENWALVVENSGRGALFEMIADLAPPAPPKPTPPAPFPLPKPD